MLRTTRKFTLKKELFLNSSERCATVIVRVLQSYVLLMWEHPTIITLNCDLLHCTCCVVQNEKEDPPLQYKVIINEDVAYTNMVLAMVQDIDRDEDVELYAGVT